jgi:hypothetical protein
MNRHNLDCQTAIVLFQITHEDRVGQTGTITLREGEIVATVNNEAVIAADSGDIVRVPVAALHPVYARAATHWQERHETAPDFIAAQALVRFIPAQAEAFALRWLGAGEAATAVSQACAGKK